MQESLLQLLQYLNSYDPTGEFTPDSSTGKVFRRINISEKWACRKNTDIQQHLHYQSCHRNISKNEIQFI